MKKLKSKAVILNNTLNRRQYSTMDRQSERFFTVSNPENSVSKPASNTTGSSKKWLEVDILDLFDFFNNKT